MTDEIIFKFLKNFVGVGWGQFIECLDKIFTSQKLAYVAHSIKMENMEIII